MQLSMLRYALLIFLFDTLLKAFALSARSKVFVFSWDTQRTCLRPRRKARGCSHDGAARTTRAI